MKSSLILLIVFLLLAGSLGAQETQLAATLEVLTAGVEVQRANTVNWITVKLEAIVGVGDTIRTDDTGRARITFFADGTDTELLPSTQYRIKAFQGDEISFDLSVEVLAGQTVQRLGRLLDVDSSYEVLTPGMALAARGTVFKIRVEDSGRSAMLVSEGAVTANNDSADADVPPGFGIRAAVDESLSEVVRAATFEELDAALDGCEVTLSTSDDVSLNVRIGPSVDFPRVGTVDAASIRTAVGVAESGDWYRIAFQGGFGWVLSSTASVDRACAGLREFPDDFGPEDVSRYTNLSDDIDLGKFAVPEATTTPGSG